LRNESSANGEIDAKSQREALAKLCELTEEMPVFNPAMTVVPT
jgi:hypothetical protein